MEDVLLGEKTIAFSIAQEILTTNANIPVFPANGRKILAVVRQSKDQIDIPDFVKLIESDPGMFVRILTLANSSYYSEMEKIVSLRAAITRIGLIDIVNTVCLYFFQKLLPKFPDIQGFSYNDFWAHSWAVAVANRRLGHPNLEMGVLPGELYMAGMLQGIGKLLLAIHYPKDFTWCLKQARELKQPLEIAEKKVFGTTDSLVASKVLTSWEFPSNICQAIAFCQMPELAPPEHIIIAGLTQFAYGIVEQSGVGRSGDGKKRKLSETCFGQRPNLKIAQPAIQEQLIEEINLSIKDRAENITSISGKSKVRPAKKQKIVRKQPALTTSREKPTKKGVFGWVRSLWN
ncbi:MAG: HDOD domain-containing protein [Pseudomonadota bacterium]